MGRIRGVPHLRLSRKLAGVPYIAGQRFNYLWHPNEVTAFMQDYAELREAGNELKDVVWFLGKKYKRNTADVEILLLDLRGKKFLTLNGYGKKPFTTEEGWYVDD